MTEIEQLKKQKEDLLVALKSLVYRDGEFWCASQNGDSDVTAIVREAIANASAPVPVDAEVAAFTKNIDSPEFEALLFAYRDAEYITGQMRDIFAFANEWHQTEVKGLFKRIRKLEREVGAANLEKVSILGEPTMLWDANEPEDGTTGESPKEFAESYASNAGLPGETHLVDVLCAYRGGKRTMSIVMLKDGGVSWSWADTGASQIEATKDGSVAK
jgi:hypothetical protein